MSDIKSMHDTEYFYKQGINDGLFVGVLLGFILGVVFIVAVRFFI